MGVCQSSESTQTEDRRGKAQEKNGKAIQANGTQKKNLAISTKEDVIINKGQFIMRSGNFDETYQVDQVLGQGGFGEVKLCTHKITKEQRAVKLMKKENISAKAKIWFENEINILKSLDHPNIVRLYEVYEDQTKYYLVQELCLGGELFDEIIKRKRFSESDAAYIMRQVLQAIIYCHEKGIVHRDLKPENILLEDNANQSLQVKVIDFGASQIVDPSKNLTERFGTIYYISPEVLNGSYKEKCDIWSLGVILYILLCGEPPFNGETDEKIMAKILKGKFEYKSSSWGTRSPESKDLINKMINMDYDKRYTAVQALNHSWFKKNDKSNDSIDISIIQNLQSFRANLKLQEAALTFIVCQLTTKKEQAKLLETFKALDINGNGMISREELLQGYTKIYQSQLSLDEIVQAVDEIMQKLDTDKSGQIDYTEWAIGTINKQEILTQEKLKKAFALFDRDNSGSISAEEIRMILGVGKQIGSEEVWSEIIKEVDTNGDGEISYEEFELMMKKVIGSDITQLTKAKTSLLNDSAFGSKK